MANPRVCGRHPNLREDIRSDRSFRTSNGVPRSGQGPSRGQRGFGPLCSVVEEEIVEGAYAGHEMRERR